MRIIVLGYIVRGPLGGLAWHHLQYVLGLSRLGHDVFFVEDSDDYPACYDPVRHVVDRDPSYGLGFAANAFGRLGLPDCWAYHDAHTSQWHGPAAGDIISVLETADVLLNVSGVNPVRPWLQHIPRRAFIDTDPVFTQIRHISDPSAGEAAERHNVYFTFGENFGQPGCTIPDDGFPWQPTRQPVLLDAWPFTPGRADGLLTTVMQWDSYPAREYGGVRYGMKSESFQPYLNVPSCANALFELAMGSQNAPRELLTDRGWKLVDPLEITRDPWTYQSYIQQSKGEFSVAKHGYVESRSGWFSERSACYMASGRPVLVQNTRFVDWLETGTGVIPFSTPDEAVAGIEDMNRRYELHCRKARDIAEEFFNSDKVLSRLVDRVMAQPSS